MEVKKKLGEILKGAGLVQEETLSLALARQRGTDRKIGEILMEMGVLKERELVRALAAQCRLPFVEKLVDEPDLRLQDLIPLEYMERQRVVPVALEGGKRLKAATTNPACLLFIDQLKLALKLEIELVFTSPEELARLILAFERAKSYFSPHAGALPQNAREDENAALIRMVRHILTEALSRRASDIHLEVSRDSFSVRYRIDGILKETEAPPKELSRGIVSRIKVMAGLDLAEKRFPQDGRIPFTTDGCPVDLRVSIIPSLHGESVVLRILRRGELKRGLHELGMSPGHEKLFRSLLRHPHGMIFVTGPTGSGKTTTLYTALEILNLPSEKIITVEDPVEYELDGVNQVQVKPAIGLTFAHTLRSILRQAPSVILVGEIRDPETAEVALQAALTGHLVFSTLHTNDAVSAIPRLIDLGIRPYLVSAATEGVMAQRLLRRICESCKEVIEWDSSLKVLLARMGAETIPQVLYRGRGCPKCQGTGYSGRIAIFEIYAFDEEFRRSITGGEKDVSSLIGLAKKRGMKSLFEDGVEKAARGLTTLAEVLRVTEGGEVSGD